MSNEKSLFNEFKLVGEKVYICAFEEKHICDDYVGWLNDVEVVKYSNQRFKKHDLHSCVNYFKSFKSTNNLFLAIHEKDSDKFLGTMTVYYSLQHRVADIGLMVGDRRYWGQGIGREAWQMLMLYLIDSGVVRKVTGGTLSCNLGMLNIMNKSGMCPDGQRIKHVLIDETPVDILYFSKFSHE